MVKIYAAFQIPMTQKFEAAYIYWIFLCFFFSF